MKKRVSRSAEKRNEDFGAFLRTANGNKKKQSDDLFIKSKVIYEKFTSESGRFAYFECNDKLFPAARPIHSKFRRDNGTQLTDISKFYHENGNILLIGEGGAGKTTSLLAAWKKMIEQYDTLHYIPLYIPLNEANKKIKGEEESFILKYINDTYKVKTLEINNLCSESFRKEERVFLLLDGFNEITDRNKQIAVAKEIKKIGESDDFRIIMTSRFDFLSTYEMEGFHKYSILPLNETIIKNYLAEAKIPVENAPIAILSNPMILTLYANMCLMKEMITESLSLPFFKNRTKGEVIANFLMCQIGKSFSIENIPATYLNYIALFVVCPYIAYMIEKKGRFDLSFSSLNSVIRGALECSCSEMDYFFDRDLYCLSSYSPFKLEISSDTISNISKLLLEDFAVFQCEERVLYFRHQYFRDFFSAQFICNDCELFIRKGGPLASLGERILPEYVSSFIGDLKQEYVIEPTNQEDFFFSLTRKIPEVTLDNPDIILNNIIGILVLAKDRNLSRMDLTKLDLNKVSLNGVIFSTERNVANFNNALIAERTFLPQGHIGQVRSAVYSADSRIILSAGDTTIKEWDCVTGLCVRTYEGHTNLVNSACFHPSGKYILSAANDNTVREWDDQGNPIHVFRDHKGYVTKAIYNGKGDKVFSCSWDGTVLAYSRTDKGWSKAKLVAKHDKNIKSICLNQDESLLLTASGDGTVREWRSDGEMDLVRSFEGHTDMVNAVTYAEKDKYILSGGYDNTVFSFCRGDEQDKKTLHLDAWVRSISYDCNSKSMFVASHNGVIYEYSFIPSEGFQLVAKYPGHKKAATNVSFSPDGKKIVSTSEDGTIREWDRKSGQCIREYPGNDYALTDTVYSQDGCSVITIKDTFFTVSKRTDGIPYFSLRKEPHPISSAVFGKTDNMILFTTKEGLFEVDTSNYDEEKCPIQLIDSKLTNCQMMYAKYDRASDSFIAIGKKRSGKSVVFILKEGEPEKIKHLPISADYADMYSSQEFLTFSGGGIIRIWDVVSGKQKGVLDVNINGCSFVDCTFENERIKRVINEAGGKT